MKTTLINSPATPPMTTQDRRKYDRAKRMDMAACLEGKTYIVQNWSMGGFFLDDYDGLLSTGALVTIAGLGRNKKSLHQVDLPARVVRTEKNSIAINYLSLDIKAYEFLQKSMSESGDMRSLVDSV